MKYLIDSNICIRHINQRSPAITKRLHETPEADIVVCSVVRAELYFGAMKSQHPETTLLKQRAFVERFASLPFDDAAAAVYGRIRADLERAGTLVGPNDMMIAAIALAYDLTLVTHNTHEFGQIAGLQLEDWDISP